MGVAGQRKVGKVLERFAAPVSCELSAPCEPAENLRDFDVQNVRGTQPFIGREEPRRACQSGNQYRLAATARALLCPPSAPRRRRH